jgi:hypothetical protein
MLPDINRRRNVEVDYERDPFTDQEIIKGIDRRVGEDYGLGAADLAYSILEAVQAIGAKEEAIEAVERICYSVIETQRIARIAMFEERMGIGGR